MTEEPLADARDMLAVHTMFRREFGLLPDLVRGVRAGDAKRAVVVGDHVALMSRMLHLHHSGEDKHIWPLLRERGAGKITQIVDVMEEQHERIHQEYLRVGEALTAWREHAPADGGDALAGASEQLIPQLEAHLSLEEDRVVPLIERYVTAAEYARLAGEGAEDTPPELLPVCLGMVMYDAEPAVIEMIIAALPAEVRPAFPRAANEAYAAYAQRLHGPVPVPKLADSR
jgi:iron-sulfur cluster repair protein YtfE (RIC family)